MNPETVKQVADTVTTMNWPSFVFLVILYLSTIIPLYYKIFGWGKKKDDSSGDGENSCLKNLESLEKTVEDNYQMLHDSALVFTTLKEKIDANSTMINTIREKITSLEGLVSREEQDIAKIVMSLAQLTAAIETLIKRM